jgi:hypothetical protein
MRLALLLAVGTLVCAAACGNAPEEVSGGEPLPVIAALTECTATGAQCSTWTYLYTCYFGPVGVASCSAQTECHASAASTGAGESNGFVCGSTSSECWHGMAQAPFAPVTQAGYSNPKSTELYSALHKAGAGSATGISNNMPLLNAANPAKPQPAYTFTAADMACIEDWIKAGAPQN